MRNVLLIAGLAAALTAPILAQSRPDFSGTWVVESVQQPERPQMGGPDGGSPGGMGPGGMGRGGMGRGGGMGGGMMGGGRRGGGGGMGGGQRQGGGPRGDRPGAAFALPQKGQQFTLVQTDERLDVTTVVQGAEQTRSYTFSTSDSADTGNAARTTWEGVALVTETTMAMPARNDGGDGGSNGGGSNNGSGESARTRTLREVRSINPDGKMVVMTTMKTPRGSMTSTVTFARVQSSGQ